MDVYKLKKGHTIKLAGNPQELLCIADRSENFALKPSDFYGVKPNLLIKEGEKVKIGAPLFTDKDNSDILFVSPASGTITKIIRGERRAVEEIIVASDNSEVFIENKKYDVDSIKKLSREKLITHLLQGGVWPFLRQRPFDKIANPKILPRDIFIVATDTNPLAPNQSFMLSELINEFLLGVEALKILTGGKLYLTLDQDNSMNPIYNINGIEKKVFIGKHPAGNIGIQLHHINPLKRNESIWHICAYNVAMLGKFLFEGKYPIERIVALTGSSMKKEYRNYYKTRIGASINSIIKKNYLSELETRIIAGSVLTGKKINGESYIGFYDRSLTVIPEGKKERELLGWSMPGFSKPSFSKAYLSRLFPKNEYIQDTRLNGGIRPFIITGYYEKVLPMDIYPEHLIKSIIIEDIDEMEALGIYECAEEDFALCSYICPSKIDFGYYIRKGLDLIEKEG